MKDARRQKQRDLRRAYYTCEGFSLYRHFAKVHPESEGPFARYRKVGPPTVYEEYEYEWIPTREGGKCTARGRSKITTQFWPAGHYVKKLKYRYEHYRWVKVWENMAGQHYWDNRRDEWIAEKIGGIDYKMSRRRSDVPADFRRMYNKVERRRAKLAVEKAIRDDDLDSLVLPHRVDLGWLWD